MNYKQELDNIEQKINENKEEKIKLEERKKHLQEEKNKILNELEQMGIKETDLENLILDLEVEIQTKIDKCKEILNG